MIKNAAREFKPALLLALVLAAAFLLPGPAAQAASATCYAYPGCVIYTGEAFGPLHPDQNSPALDSYPVFSSPLVRAAHPAPYVAPPSMSGAPGVNPPYAGLVLDAFGGLHPYNQHTSAAYTPIQFPYFPGRDIARDFVYMPQTGGYGGFGGYVLDGFGGIHPFDATVTGFGQAAMPPAPGQFAYFSGRDLAKKITTLADGSGGYVLDAFGGIHPWSVSGNPLPVAPSQFGYWPNVNIARDMWLDPASTATSVSGYVLDGFGGFHPFWGGSASAPAAITQHPYYPGHDIARIAWFQPNANAASSAGYELDGFGGIHPFASEGNPLPPPLTDFGYWPGRDIARALFGA